MHEQQDDFTALLAPSLSLSVLNSWLENCTGRLKAEDVCYNNLGSNIGLVRDMKNNGAAHILHNAQLVSKEDLLSIDAGHVANNLRSPSFLDSDRITGRMAQREIVNPEECITDDDNLVVLEVTRLTKRSDLLHMESVALQESGIKWLFLEYCAVDRLPFTYSRFALMIPSILHKLHINMVVEYLCKTLLSQLGIRDKTLIATAICSSSAREPTNYQRLEFLGDSILKLSTSLALMAIHLKYHEGILSGMKDHIVSNGSLARAAVRTGLDRFIITKQFTGSKWRPLYNNRLLARPPSQTRQMSTKILADVVEALIGASYLDGGYEKAIGCMKIFLPDVSWDAAIQSHDTFHGVYGRQVQPGIYVSAVEQLIGYKFNYQALAIEAITHASCQTPGVAAPYERLEFLGDSVLDNIVTIAAFSHDPPIPVHRLHLIRSALVNADYLGYLCLRHSIELSYLDPVMDDPKNITTVESIRPYYLWQILRHASRTIRTAQEACLERLHSLENQIAKALMQNNSHPWTLLARLEPPKPFSDIIESLLGAIYIDSRGSMEACANFLENIGLMAYLRRVIETDIALLHPKEELGQLSNQDEVRYIMGTGGEEGNKRLTCVVMVGERELSSVGDGLKPLEVQTRAAEIACDLLKRERQGNGEKEQHTKDVSEEDFEDGESWDDEEGGVEVPPTTEKDLVMHDEADDDDVYMTADE